MGDGGVTPEFLAAVSEHTGVPKQFLSGNTIPEVWASARQAVEWKEATAPPPPTAAVSASSQPYRIPMQSLVPGNDDWMTAWRAGRLTPMGVPQPPPRRNGEAHKNAGPP
jgi:hypothetical protein